MESYNNSYASSSKHYNSALHSVRRGAPAKPWKKPVAPLPPTPPRVYKVDPINFRDLVQQLTAAPEYTAPGRRLHSMAPPPFELHRPTPAKHSPSLSNVYKEFSDALITAEDNNDKKPLINNGGVGHRTASETAAYTAGGFLGLNLTLSPKLHNYNWCSFPMLSPGTLSSLDQSTVL